MKTLLLLLLTLYFNKPRTVEKLLFTVDGKPFFLSDYVAYLELKNLKKISTPPASFDSLKDFINFVLMSEEASARGYSVSEADIDKDITMIALKTGVDRDSLLNFVHQKFGISPEKFREMRRRYILVNYLLSPYLRNIRIDQDEVEAFYRQHIRDFSKKRVKVILITSEREVKFYSKISPSELHSYFPDASTSVMEVKEGEFKRSLEREIFSARKGDIVGPLKGGGKFTYFYLLDDPAISPEPLESVRDKIVEILQEEKREEVVNKILEEISFNHYLEKCFSVKNDEVDFDQRGSCGSGQ